MEPDDLKVLSHPKRPFVLPEDLKRDESSSAEGASLGEDEEKNSDQMPA